MGLETIDLDRIRLAPGDRILDLGCGQGRHALQAYVTDRVHAVGLDMNPNRLSEARRQLEGLAQDDPERRLSFLVGDGMKLPFSDASFDKVICAEVLEHLHDYERVVAEVRRILRPGGVLAVSVPRFGPEWLCWKLSRGYREEAGGHVRIFKRTMLKRSIERFGLHRFDQHWAHGLHSPYWWLRCLFWESADSNPLVQGYHRFLVWELMAAPRWLRGLECALNPLMGKSTVLYFVKGT